MDFGGDRVSWWANAARSMRSLEERPPLTAGGLGPAQGPQKPEGLGALKCILWLFLALIFIILHIEMYVFSVWIIHFIDIFPGMSNLNNFSIAILHTRMTRKQAPTLISRSWNSLSRSILSLARRKDNLHNYLKKTVFIQCYYYYLLFKWFSSLFLGICLCPDSCSSTSMQFLADL